MVNLKVIYFEKSGPQNTDSTLNSAKQRAEELNIKDIIVASTKGDTGIKAAKLFSGFNLVVVSHCTGFRESNSQELSHEKKDQIEKEGGKILTCQHSFGGIGRAIRKKFNTYQVDEIVAHTFRTFGEGTKVAVEITLMACDAGLIPSGKEVISIGGTSTGADTALVLKSANTHSFFDLEIKEIICKPREHR
ncbi:MAG: hypothetical protein AMJ90_05075 [candidate division Zixibacteria bacterium SM23_73_2]|nr:MAG: hypothetical protein AMJ90_05075 [candidate division Zixibacteria bacterium SM23_73_2]